MENKHISTQVINNLLDLIKKVDYYNKIQITFNYESDSFFTESFYFYKGQWGHSIFKQITGNNTPEVIQDVQMLEDDVKIFERLGSLENDAKVIIASNSPEYILSVKL